MSFMQPHVEFCSMWHVETSCGTELIPDDCVGADPSHEDFSDFIEGTIYEGETPTLVEGFYARLSAPGYMDCTAWSGPYSTSKEAYDDLETLYGIDDSDE